jgi:hypothetical protein
VSAVFSVFPEVVVQSLAKEQKMPKSSPKNTKKRTEVRDLPKAKKRMTKDAAKKIKGGHIPGSVYSVDYSKIKA